MAKAPGTGDRPSGKGYDALYAGAYGEKGSAQLVPQAGESATVRGSDLTTPRADAQPQEESWDKAGDEKVERQDTGSQTPKQPRAPRAPSMASKTDGQPYVSK